MHRHLGIGLLALAALLGHVACGSTTAAGGGNTAIAKDAITANDIAETLDAAADAALDTAPPDAAADIAQTDAVAEDAAPDAALDVAQDVKTAVKTVGGLVLPPLAPPTFTKVVDSTGVTVTPDALQGHWTVLWFYPAASTAG